MNNRQGCFIESNFSYNVTKEEFSVTKYFFYWYETFKISFIQTNLYKTQH